MAGSKGEIHDSFERLLTDLQQFHAGMALAMQGKGAPEWQIPRKDEWSGDPLKIDEISKAFDREKINNNVEEVMQSAEDAGTVGDVSSLKVQGDWLAVMERGFRARHATPVRCLGHAAARAAGKGKPSGVFFGGVLGYAQNLLRLGQK